MDSPGNWQLVFSDDFDGNALNTGRWATQFPWGSTSATTPLAVYRPQNVTVKDGTAVLTAMRDDTSPLQFTTGMISTGGNGDSGAGFEMTHGFVEVRARLPRGSGLWPAIWLLPTSGAWPPEIDVMEWTGSRPDVVEMTYHYLDKSEEHQSQGQAKVGEGFADGYHTFAVEWSRNAIRWYVDGKQRRQAFLDRRFISNQPMYLLLTLQIGGGTDDRWAGTPDAATPFPAQFRIDYVRVWKPR